MKIKPINPESFNPKKMEPGYNNSAGRFSDILRSQEARLKTSLNNESRYIKLGTISKNNPTISHLLIKQPVYGKKCWQIIHSDINRLKPYTTIPEGTHAYLNPATLEIKWEALSAPSPVARNENSEKADFSDKLVGAVKQYIGRAHKEIDCYELLVHGLNEVGVKYRGYGGLKESLMKMAAEHNLPYNTYFSGEGLISAAGSAVYSKSTKNTGDPKKEADNIMNEMKPLLKKGAVLSFSTLTKGHTGLVSKKGNLWTYINSGRMDNVIGKRSSGKSVGEETLSAEIKNWLRLAARRNESLYITLGQFDEKKLTAFSKNKIYGT